MFLKTFIIILRSSKALVKRNSVLSGAFSNFLNNFIYSLSELSYLIFKVLRIYK